VGGDKAYDTADFVAAPKPFPNHKITETGENLSRSILFPQPARESIPFSSIDRLDGHQHAHLRCDLNHLSASRQARSRLIQSGGAAAFH
jgi:hypothetical protein